MKGSSVLYSTFFSLIALIQQVASLRCSKEILGRTIFLNCPEASDSSDKIYCCGTEKRRYCCNTEEFAKTINAIGLIIGVLISAIVVIVVIVVVSCFCCSCCLLAKRRQQRGRVLYGPTSTTTVPYPTQTTAANTATTYPTQTTGSYPTQTASSYPTQYPYPPQQYPPQYPPQQPPQQYAPSGYQGYAPPANPPPYSSVDQPPFNPEYSGK